MTKDNNTNTSTDTNTNTNTTASASSSKKQKQSAYRAFEIMQYEKNSKTGEDLHFNEDTIKKALSHKTIKKWSYVRHDRDLREDGSKKGEHWHVYIATDCALTIETVARWFGVQQQYVEIKKGENSFLDCTQYFTHELQSDKARYDDSEIKSNLDWRDMLNKKAENIEKYGSCTISVRDMQRIDVLKFGKTLAQCKEADALLYIKEMQTLQKCRAEYLFTQPAPSSRVNFYISGSGGVGKGITSRALARALFPDRPDSEVFFEVGAEGALFEGYDGQPVLIWNDFRAQELLWTLGSRSAVFNVFDTIPSQLRLNVKYSSVKLLNTVNIVNSVQSYRDFCDSLAGEYRDRQGNKYKAELHEKQQAYRRFPCAISLDRDSTTFTLSKGYIEHTSDFMNFEESHVHGNARYIAQYVKDEATARKYEQQLLETAIFFYENAMSYNDDQILDNEAEFFRNFGSEI